MNSDIALSLLRPLTFCDSYTWIVCSSDAKIMEFLYR